MTKSAIEQKIAGPQSEAERRAQAGGEPPEIEQQTSDADDLVAIRQAIKKGAEPKRFELPGYGPRLQVEYRVIDADEVDEVFEKLAAQVKAKKVDRPMVAGLVDTMIAACVGFYSERTVDRDGDTVTETVPFEEKYGLSGGPVRWGDPRLWEALRLEVEPGETLTVRQAIEQIFGDDRMLVQEHAQEVARWMEDARRSVKTDF